MADNIAVTAGSGETVAADEISGAKYQRVKLIEGADGANDGDISSANPLPVELTDADGTAAADITAIKAAVEGTITTNGSVTGIAGADGKSNSTSFSGLFRNSSGGGLAGSVLPYVFNGTTWDRLRGDTSGIDISDISAGTQTNDVKVTLDGESVTETNSAAILADTASMDTNLATLAGAVTGTEVQVDVVAALPAGTNNIGDVDVLTQPARDNATDTITASLDTNSIMNDTTALTPKFAAINATTNGDNTIVAAVVGKKVRVLSYSLVADAAVGCAFEDGAGGTELTGQMAFAANGGISVAFSPVGHFETTPNTLLNLETDAAANVRGHICYVEV